MKKVLALALVGSLALAAQAPQASAQNLLQNSDFYSGLQSWTQYDNGDGRIGGGGSYGNDPYAYSYCTQFSMQCGVGQTINTVAGDVYSVSYALAAGSGPGGGGVIWNGTVVDNETYYGGDHKVFEVDNLLATSSTMNLQFVIWDQGDNEHLYDTSAMDEGPSGIAVPEPSSIVLLASMAFLGLGAAHTTRKNSFGTRA